MAEARRVADEIEREWTALIGARRMAELRRSLEALHDALWPGALNPSASDAEA